MIPILAISLILGKGSSVSEKIKSIFFLNEDRGLSQQGLLWISILSPILYFIVFGSIGWYGHTISITSKGLTEFFDISVLALGMLSLALPLSVFVSRLHATKQTAKQIRIAQQKNNIDLFNSHRKELFGYFSQIGEVNYFECLTGKFKVHPRVHKNFFIGTPESGIPNINEGLFINIESELNSARWMLDKIIRDINPDNTYSFYLANFCSTIYRLSEKLGLPEIYRDLAQNSLLVPVMFNKEAMEVLTVGKTTAEAVAAYRYANDYFHNLCDFAGREQEAIELIGNDELKYIDIGGKFLTINSEKVIERLHENEIQEAISSASKKNNTSTPTQ